MLLLLVINETDFYSIGVTNAVALAYYLSSPT